MVKLIDVAKVLDSSNSTVRFYYDRKEDEVVCIIDAFLPAHRSLLKRVESDGGAKFVMVDPVENIGYAAMQAFAVSQPEGDLKDRLTEAVSAGGMRRFRNVVEDSGILDVWKGFRQDFLSPRRVHGARRMASRFRSDPAGIPSSIIGNINLSIMKGEVACEAGGTPPRGSLLRFLREG